MTEKGNNIKVFVRVRPLSEMEQQMDGTNRCIDQPDEKMIKVTNFEGTGSNPYLQFTFDRVFHENSQQVEVYGHVAKDIVGAAFQGLNGTIFCYGQTASGKTYTCVGPQIIGPNKGLLPRIIDSVMEGIRLRPSNIDMRAKVSLVEIYNEKVTDLLDLTRRNLKLRENRNKGVFIEHVTERYISMAQEGYELLQLGLENRSVGFTQMNALSSRSHMLFMITVIQNDFASGQAKSARLTVIDLAGSQKISKTGTEGKQLNEAIKINTSLSALGNVIHALSQGKSHHIPYRDSKLTRLLQESLGGNSLTSLIVNVSPSLYNEAETVTSLRFGHRAKAVKNSPKINKEYTVEQLLCLLQRAQLKIKAQNKLIDELTKKKRVGGYGIIQDRPLTLHILKDEEDDNDSGAESISQIEDNSNSKKFKRPSIDKPIRKKRTLNSTKQQMVPDKSNTKNLYKLASSLKCLPHPESQKNHVRIAELDSLTSQQNLLDDVEERVMARTRSQATLMADSHQQLKKQNEQLRKQVDTLKDQMKMMKDQLKSALDSLDTFRTEAKIKEEIISKKNLVIERLRQKNQQRKAEMEMEINNLKKFWEKYYLEMDQDDKSKSVLENPRTLNYSDSTATLKNTRTSQRTKVVRAKTQTEPL